MAAGFGDSASSTLCSPSNTSATPENPACAITGGRDALVGPHACEVNAFSTCSARAPSCAPTSPTCCWPGRLRARASWRFAPLGAGRRRALRQTLRHLLRGDRRRDSGPAARRGGPAPPRLRPRPSSRSSPRRCDGLHARRRCRAPAGSGSTRRNRRRPHARPRRRRERSSRSATASAAGTTAHPGCALVTGSKSSVSSAWANMPLASAALIAEVRRPLAQTAASGVPPCCRTNRTAISPGLRRAPEIMAPSVSRMRSPVCRAASGGSARPRAAAMYDASRAVMSPATSGGPA